MTDKVRMNPGPAAAESSVCRAPSHGAAAPLPNQPDPAEAGVVRATMLPAWSLPIPAPQPPGRPCVGRHLMAPPTPCRPGPAGAQGRPGDKVARLVSAYPGPAAAGSSVCRAPSHGAAAPLPNQPDPAEAGVVRAATLPAWCLPIPAPRPQSRPCVGRHLMAPPNPCRAGPVPRRRGSSERQRHPPGVCPSRPRSRRVVRV